MFITFVDNHAFNGLQEHNPFDFDHFHLNYICCTYDGTQYPAIAYTPHFAEKKYAREYAALFLSLGQDKTDTYINLSYDEFAKCPIFGFNFSPDMSDGAGTVGHVSELVKGSLRLQMRFNKALDNPINIIAYCEFDLILEISDEGIIATSLNGNVAN